MKLIEDLGYIFATNDSKVKVLMGIYECPVCLQHFRCHTGAIKHNDTTMCHKCACKAYGKVVTQEASIRFISEASVMHSNKYEYTLVNYVDAHTPVSIICPTHGIFPQAPNSHKRGRGCPSCTNTGFDKAKPGLLYYLKVSYGTIITYKIGITNHSVQERFSNSDLEKITIVHEWRFSSGADAYFLEQNILRSNKGYKYTGKPILASGNTELFTEDVLFLDTTP